MASRDGGLETAVSPPLLTVQNRASISPSLWNRLLRATGPLSLGCSCSRAGCSPDPRLGPPGQATGLTPPTPPCQRVGQYPHSPYGVEVPNSCLACLVSFRRFSMPQVCSRALPASVRVPTSLVSGPGGDMGGSPRIAGSSIFLVSVTWGVMLGYLGITGSWLPSPSPGSLGSLLLWVDSGSSWGPGPSSPGGIWPSSVGNAPTPSQSAVSVWASVSSGLTPTPLGNTGVPSWISLGLS